MTFDVEKIREDFPALSQKVHGHPLVYLDNAATTLKPRAVVEAITNHYLYGAANIHRGVHYLSEQATTQFEQARTKVRKLLNVAHEEEVIFTSGTTQAINFVAEALERSGRLRQNDEVVISHMEHHSNIIPWQMVAERTGCKIKVVPIDESGALNVEAYYDLLSPRTKLVSMVYISNSLGTINPIGKVVEAAHDVGAYVLVDGAQAVAHQEVDVQALDCDFFAFSAHKMFGPTGCGVLYGKKELLTALPPFQGGGDMIKTVSFNGSVYADLPAKMEAGTPHIAGVIGLGAAIDYVNSLGLAAINAYETELLAYGTEVLSSIDGLRLIGTASKKASVLSFVMEGLHPHDVGTIVDQKGVAIRTGHHCTQPVMEFFQVPATARASISIYNTKRDLDILVESLLKAKELFA